jgi:hypothetical protein
MVEEWDPIAFHDPSNLTFKAELSVHLVRTVPMKILTSLCNLASACIALLWNADRQRDSWFVSLDGFSCNLLCYYLDITSWLLLWWVFLWLEFCPIGTLLPVGRQWLVEERRVRVRGDELFSNCCRIPTNVSKWSFEHWQKFNLPTEIMTRTSMREVCDSFAS